MTAPRLALNSPEEKKLKGAFNPMDRMAARKEALAASNAYLSISQARRNEIGKAKNPLPWLELNFL
jgi:hypothetical protein